MITVLEGIIDVKTKEEPNCCNRFLVDLELEQARHWVFNFAMSSFNNSFLNEKLDLVFDQLHPKLTLRSDLYWETLKIERVDTFMQTKTILLLRGLNMCVPRMIWPTWKIIFRKWILLIIALEEERTLNGSFTNLQLSQFLLRYSKINTWDVKILYYLNPFLKNHDVNCPTFEKNTTQPYIDNFCSFRALALHLHGNDKLEEESSKFFSFFLLNCEEGDLPKF